MDIVEIKAQARESRGKSLAKRLREAGQLPVVLYGSKDATRALSVKTREFETLFRSRAGSNMILKLVVEGGETSSVMVKEIQRDPVRDNMLHVDFLRVALDEKIVAGVSVKIIGDSIGIKEGGVLQHGSWELQVEALPTDLPEYIEVDVSELDIGQSIHAGEIQLPPELVMVSAAEEVVVSIVAPTKEVLPEPEEVEEELELAEGEKEPEEGTEEAGTEEASKES